MNKGVSGIRDELLLGRVRRKPKNYILPISRVPTSKLSINIIAF